MFGLINWFLLASGLICMYACVLVYASASIWLFGCFVVLLVGWLAGRLAGWAIGWLVGWLVGSFVR